MAQEITQQPKKHASKWRYFRRALLATLVLSLVIAAPYVYFYFEYLRPTHTIPVVEEAQTDQSVHSDAETGSLLTKILSESREMHGLPSLSAAVGYSGEVQWATATGYADIESRKLASTLSRYRIGSTSKALTGVLLARMIDQGKINIDAPISTYYATVPPQYSDVTARQLASHTAGVRHYSIPNWWMANWENYADVQYNSVEEGLSLISGDSLLFPPGSDFKYSTFGYSLLSRQMELAGKSDFAALMKQQLLVPANMPNTSIDDQTAVPEKVSFYNADSGLYRSAISINSSYKIAGGGLLSTPSDLVNLGLQLLGDNLISERTKKLMWTPVPIANGKQNPGNYGLGWRMDSTLRILGPEDPVAIIHHGGVQPGGACFYLIIPKSRLVVAVTTNSGSGTARSAVQDVAYELARILISSEKVPR